MASDPFQGSGSLLTIDIKLDGLNYRELATSLCMQIWYARFAFHLTDEPPDERKEDGKKFAYWQRIDNRAMGFLCIVLKFLLEWISSIFLLPRKCGSTFSSVISRAVQLFAIPFNRTFISKVCLLKNFIALSHVCRGNLIPWCQRLALDARSVQLRSCMRSRTWCLIFWCDLGKILSKSEVNYLDIPGFPIWPWH